MHPLVVGQGAKLFPEGTPLVPLELVGSKTFAPVALTRLVQA